MDSGVASFRGIPYAAAPVGPRRFLPAMPPNAWEGVLDADRHGRACPQPVDGVLGHATPGEVSTIGALFGHPPTFEQDEACTTLSIWTPSPERDAALPVLVYVHGGGFTTKFGAVEESTVTDGDALAAGGAVVVTVNHRLGVLGFLQLGGLLGDAYASSGNAGLSDLIAALSWIQEEIDAFGGNPSRVLLFGESGGAMKVCALLASPAARGLFASAALHSGPLLEALSVEQAEGFAEDLVAELGLSRDSAASLLAVPVSRLIDAQEAVMSRTSLRAGLLTGLAPVIDNTILVDAPFAGAHASPVVDVPLLVGSTRDELTIFAEAATSGSASIDEPLLKQGTYEAFRRDVWLLADRRADAGATVFTFRFDWPSTALDGRLGAAHALDIPFVMGTTGRAPICAGPSVRQLAGTMLETWVSFARDGVPRLPTGAEWPAHRPYTRDTLIVDDVVSFQPSGDAVLGPRRRMSPSEWLDAGALMALAREQW